MAQEFRCLRLVLGIPPESGSARLGHIPSLPWESQLPLKPCLSLQPSDFKGNCDFSDSLLDFCCVSLCSSAICFANVGYSPTPRQHFWKTAAPKNFLIAYGLWLKTMFSGNQLRTIRQIRFAVCLCAVRRWLRCPNYFSIFLRLSFSWIFSVCKMANSICPFLLDFNTI